MKVSPTVFVFKFFFKESPLSNGCRRSVFLASDDISLLNHVLGLCKRALILSACHFSSPCLYSIHLLYAKTPTIIIYHIFLKISGCFILKIS